MKLLVLGLLVPAALAALWWLTAAEGWLPDQLLPAPGLVVETLIETAESGDLWADILISLERVGEGFALGAAAGILFGGAIGLSQHLRALFDPLFLFLAQVPPIAWIPLAILAVGIDEAMKVTVIAWASFVPVVLGTAQGIRDVPDGFRELAQALTFDPWSLVSRIVLPAAVPAMFTGLREGLANAWQTLVAAELFASSEGLGYLISLGRQLFQLDLVLAMVVVLGLVGLSLNGLLALVERRLLSWQAPAS